MLKGKKCSSNMSEAKKLFLKSYNYDVWFENE